MLQASRYLMLPTLTHEVAYIQNKLLPHLCQLDMESKCFLIFVDFMLQASSYLKLPNLIHHVFNMNKPLLPHFLDYVLQTSASLFS